MWKGDICTIVEVCAFISLTANPRAASCQEGGIPARDHSCPGPTWHCHSPLPTGGQGQRGRGTATPALRVGEHSDPRAPSGEAGYTNPKGAGQNLSQTMLRHLTVGLTVGSVVILRYQTQPCIARRASTKGAVHALCGNSPFCSPTPRTAIIHTALLFKQ